MNVWSCLGEKSTSHAEPAVPSAAVPGMIGMSVTNSRPSSVPFVIDVDPILAAIARVDEPVLADHDAMRMAAVAAVN